MKKAIIISAVALMAISMTSCSHYRYAEGRMMDSKPHFEIIPPTAKINVEPLIVQETRSFEGTELEEATSGAKTPNQISDKLKVILTYETLKKYNGDVLVAPLFNVRSELDGKRYVIEVRAHIGKYVEWDSDGVQVEVVAQ
ncbi:MAG: hypothetical protein IJ761_06695 [Bacteroidales bacterium]|nr:hypothetical protein [Bacteroidales bacterium]